MKRILKINSNFMPNKAAIIAVFFGFSSLLPIRSIPLFAGEQNQEILDEKEEPLSPQLLRTKSQISYRAEGGFTGVESYGVIISCVDGKISVLKSIQDPRLGINEPIRRKASMDWETYLSLWKSLNDLALFKTKDAAPPKMEILDEFTFSFQAKLGEKEHQFSVYGISRPEASRYFAMRRLIDEATNMKSFWEAHTRLAKK